ncbi:hypothetical protein [Methanococcoides sp. AM1]|uniref:hypothetical protein n=1 Tax=Methanococcoides sp. AM1 TaxID=1201011 RepID=UPI0010832DAD|nr:hypothetical protein [Methanococcoides sp. AM1]
MDKENRSYLKIKREHLQKLRHITVKDQDSFFSRYPKYNLFREKIYCILLVQGAALHYVNGINGIKDFDVLVLYKENGNKYDEDGKLIRIYPKRVCSYDCEMAEFGRYPNDDIDKYPNRRVDVLMREIGNDLTDNSDLITAINKYFENGTTQSIKEWRKKAVVGIWPDEIQSKVMWHKELILD